MLRIAMTCVLQGGATVNLSPAEHVLSVVLLFPALVGLYWANPHPLVKGDGAEIGQAVRGWWESWPCPGLVCHEVTVFLTPVSISSYISWGS